MEKLLFNHQKYEEQYRCDYPLTPLPGFSKSYQKVRILYIVLAAFFTILYVPCLYVIWQAKLIKESCYKIMFFLAIMDVTLVVMSGTCGAFALTDYSYCDSPVFMYVFNAVKGCAWHAHIMSTLLLAFNRCVFMMNTSFCRQLFGGCKTWIWIVCFPLTYGILCMFLNCPAIFSNFVMAAIANPHLGYHDIVDSEFTAPMRTPSNAIGAGVLPVFYLIFFVLLKSSQKNTVFTVSSLHHHHHHHSISSKNMKHVFVQICVICLFTTLTVVLFLTAPFMPKIVPISIMFHVSSILCCGSPSLLYLCINKTIRTNVILLLKNGHLAATSTF